MASQHAVRFVSGVAEVFMREVLSLPYDANLIDCDSTIFDFGPRHPAMRLSAYEFSVIMKTIRTFGVDITAIVRRPLPEIFHYIRTKLPPRPFPRPPVDEKELLPFEK